MASKNADGWSCLHDAALCDDEWLLAALFLASEKQVWRTVHQHEATFVQALEQLPDFAAEIFVEARSWVPLVSQVLPSDTIRVWKRGAQLRCDMALKGLDGVTWKKGWISQMFLGRGNNRIAAQGHAVILDRDAKTFYDVNQAASATTVENIDLALQVMLTTAMSTSTMHTTDLEFVPHGHVKAVASSPSGRPESVPGSAAATSRRRARQCPWGGTKYKIRNFGASAQFRPVVNSKRKMRTATETSADGDPLDELQDFVNHLASASKGKKNKGPTKEAGITDSDGHNEKKKRGLFSRSANEPSTRHGDGVNSAHSPSSSSMSRSSDSVADRDSPLQTLHLPRGKKVEMHLDVVCGDIIEWSFTASSRDFRFSATHFHDDQQLPVCQTTRGVKNATIAGQYQVDHHGSFVLLWMNTQPSQKISLDRRNVTIKYTVRHTRPVVVSDPNVEAANSDLSGGARMSFLAKDEHQETDDDTSPPTSQERSRTTSSLTDAEKLAFFQQRDLRVLPNPLTSTVSFNEYFCFGAGHGGHVEPSNPDDSKATGSKMSAFFKRHTKSDPTASTPSLDTQPVNGDKLGYKNTFRSLTVLPTERRVSKEFEPKVVMAEEFPFHLRDFIPVMDFIATTGDHVKNLKEFFHMVSVTFTVPISSRTDVKANVFDAFRNSHLDFLYSSSCPWRSLCAALSPFSGLSSIQSWMQICSTFLQISARCLP